MMSCFNSFQHSKLLANLDNDTGYGLWLLFNAVRNALDHEKERVLTQHVKAATKEGKS